MAISDWILNPKNGWKVFAAVGLLSLPLIALTLFDISDTANETKPVTSSSKTDAKLTPSTNAGKLAAAREITNKPSPSAAELEEAALYLKAIPADADEHKAAQILLTRLSAIAPKQTDDSKSPLTNKPGNMTKRREAIARMQQESDKNNGAMNFTLEGGEEEVLRISSPVMSQEVAKGLATQSQLLTNLKMLGIKTIVFSDGKSFTSAKNL